LASQGTAQTVSQGAFQVGTDLTYPPNNYFDDRKEPAGFDVEFMTALSKAAKLEVRFQDTRFENLIIGVSGNKFDVMASTLYVKPERAKQIDFIPYMRQVFRLPSQVGWFSWRPGAFRRLGHRRN
jgi:polar amino acid transport system substrate-binding protein